jgi:flagellar protein FliO/FliZ
MRIRIVFLFLLPMRGLAQSSVAPSIVDSWLQIATGLAIVLGFIFVLSYLVKRFNLNVMVQGPLKVIASTSLGHQSKIVIVELGEQRYLVGVTPQQVQLIDKLPESFDITSVKFKSSTANQRVSI